MTAFSQLVVNIKGVNYGPDYSAYPGGLPGAGIVVSLQAQTAGIANRIGTATLTLKKDGGGGYSFLPKQEVQIYEWNGTYITAVYFGGFVNRVRTGRAEGSNLKTWLLDLQDYNILFLRLVGKAQAANRIHCTIGLFESQVATVVAGVNGIPAQGIDTSQVAGLGGAAQLPEQYFSGKSLGNMLAQLGAALQVAIPTVRAVFALAPDYTVGSTRTTFGAPVLYAYDSALLPPPVRAYSDTPSGAQQGILSATGYIRTLDSNDEVDWRQSLFTGNPPGVYTSSNATAIATYGNPYDPDSAWKTEPLVDSQSSNGSGATALATQNNGVGAISVSAGGSGYTSAPAVAITGGGGSGATGTAVLSNGIGDPTITAAGTGYTSAPAVLFSGGGGTGAAVTAVIRGGGVEDYIVTSGGSGYQQGATVSITSLSGTGALATAVINSAGVLINLTRVAAGSGYTSATVTIVGTGGTGAAGTATISGGHVTGITMTSRGTGYATAPTITLTGGGGTGATATCALTGVVGSVTTGARGSGYTSPPTVGFSGGAGSGAAATAALTGVVASVAVTAGGSQYAVAPLVTFTGGAGTGATATATVNNNIVTAVNVTNGGSGYTSAPTVVFTPWGSGNGNAQSVIDADVAATAFPRETVEITSDSWPPPLPGQTVSLSLLLEGLINVVYLVAATACDFLLRGDGTLLVRSRLTLGLPQLQMREAGHAAQATAPQVGVPPAQVTGFTLSGNSFDPYIGNTVLTFTWTAAPSPIQQYRISLNGNVFGFYASNATTGTLRVNPGQAFSATIAVQGGNGLWSLESAAVAGTSAAAYAPDPPTLSLAAPAGIDAPGARGFVIVQIAPPGTTHGPHDQYWLRIVGGGITRMQPYPGTNTQAAIYNLAPGVTYTIDAFSRAFPAWDGPYSAPLVVTIGGIGPPPPSGSGAPDRLFAGWTPSDASRAQLDKTKAYKAPGSFRLAFGETTNVTDGGVLVTDGGVQVTDTGSLGAQTVTSDPIPCLAGQTLVWQLAYQQSNAVPNLTLYVDWYTGVAGGGALLSTTTITPSAATTAWQSTENQMLAPATAQSAVARIVASALALSILWVSVFGGPQATTVAANYSPGSVADAAIATAGITDPTKLALKTSNGSPLNLYASDGTLLGQIYATHNGPGGPNYTIVRGVMQDAAEYVQVLGYAGAGLYIGENGSTIDGGDVRIGAPGGNGFRAKTGGDNTLIGGVNWPQVAKTAAYTATANDHTIRADATIAAFAVTLPAATTAGREYTVYKTDATANAVTVTAGAGDTINGAATAALAARYNTITVEADGIHTWFIKAKN